MNYLDIVNLVFSILTTLATVIMIAFVFFFFVGIFKRKKYPHTDKINKYGIIIPARNEEKVVGGLIESIQASNYPQDKLTIFVIAHNCTDNTAEVARKYGVEVYEYNNPNECTMGYAFKYLFKMIEKDFKVNNFDGFFIFNADNIVSNNYFEKMNDAFEYFGHKSVVTSYRGAKNFGTNWISGMYGLYFAFGCVYESRARTLLGCSTRVQGTGYVIASDVVKNGNWPYVSLTEDWEFSADQILNGNRINYCDEAVFFDEQPTKFSIMWRQRIRWSAGHLLVCKTRLKDLFKALFSKNTKHRFSVYDILTNILPFTLILTFLCILQCIFTLFSPLAGISLQDAFLGLQYDNFMMNFLMPAGFLYGFLRNLFVSYVGAFLTAVIAYIICNKKIKNVPLYKKIIFAFVWPLFVFLQFFIDVVALVRLKHITWKTIPHDDKNDIKSLS